MSELQHRRTTSRGSNISNPPRSPSPPSLTYHPSILPRSVPTPALVESVAGAAHYSGIRIEPESQLQHRRSSHGEHDVHSELKADHRRVLADLKELYCCRPTLEIFERSWSRDASFEVRYDPFNISYGANSYDRTLSRNVRASTSTQHRQATSFYVLPSD
jgi:hypothetical protein